MHVLSQNVKAYLALMKEKELSTTEKENHECSIAMEIQQ